MTIEQKQNYIELLKKNNSSLANAILFYITNKNPEFEKKKQFVEKIVDRYVKVISVSTNRYEKHIILSGIPVEIISKLITAHPEDLKKQQNTADEDLIAEMNEIF